MRESGSPVEKRPFPLDVVRFAEGWAVVVYREDGSHWHLLKPGWQEEKHLPYIFDSEEQAWRFVRDLFMFCIKQARLQHRNTDKVMNCEQCGRVIRAKFFEYCHQCLQENEFMFQQIWQGFYYLTGSSESALHRMALLLKVPVEQFSHVPQAFKTMVQRHLDLYLSMESQRNQGLQAWVESKSAGMYSGRRHRRVGY